MSSLVQNPRVVVVDSSGTPRASAKRYLYSAGTLTPLTSYSDSDLSTPHANPQVADSAGVFSPAYLPSTVSTYRQIVKTSADVTLSDDDEIPTVQLTADAVGTVLYPRTTAEQSASITPTDYIYAPGTPERYGAVGDGATDDTEAFTDAINSTHPVTLTKGATYLLNTWTAVTPATALFMVGNGATVKGPASTVDFLSPTTNFDIRGVTFDRWASVVERLEAQTGSFTSVFFVGNRCVNCTGRVFDIERTIDRFVIAENDFESCTGGYAVHIGTNTYASQDTWQKGVIRNNRFKTISASSTTSAAAILVYGRDIEISGNIIDGVTQSGTGEAWGIYTKVRHGRVFGNTVKNVVPTGSDDNAGINIKGLTRAETATPQGFANLVFGNTVRDIGTAGTRGHGIRAQTDDVHIYGNLVEDPGLNGITSDEATAHSNIRITGNLIQYGSLTAGTSGIRLEGYGTNIVAESNTVRRATNGIRLTTGAAGDMNDGAVRFNVLRGCTNNIVVDAFTGYTLLRPVIEGNFVDGGTYGLLNNGSAGTISAMRILRNDFALAATPVVSSLGTSPVISGNIGYLTGSATFDPSNLADGAGETTTVTVTGAVLGDYASASFSLDLQGITVTAWVSSSNTVSVRFQNETGGAVNLSSGTLKAIAERR